MKTILKFLALVAILAVVGAVLAYVMRAPLPRLGQHSASAVAPQAPGTSPEATSSSSVSIPMTIETIKEQASSSPTVSVEYPQFPSLPASFNDAVKSSVLARLAQFRSTAAENYAARKATATPGDTISPSDLSFIAQWEPAQVNSKYVSFIIRFDAYTGGANADQQLETFDYDVAAGRMISIGDLFATSTDYLSTLSSMARQQIVAHIKETGGPDAPTDMVAAGTAPIPDNFKDFTFTDYLLTIYFPKYAVAPGSFGEQKVVVPLAELR